MKKPNLQTMSLTALLSLVGCGTETPGLPSPITTSYPTNSSQVPQHLRNTCYLSSDALISTVITEVRGMKEMGLSRYEALQQEAYSCSYGPEILYGMGTSPELFVYCNECMGAIVEHVYP